MNEIRHLPPDMPEASCLLFLQATEIVRFSATKKHYRTSVTPQAQELDRQPTWGRSYICKPVSAVTKSGLRSVTVSIITFISAITFYFRVIKLDICIFKILSLYMLTCLNKFMSLLKKCRIYLAVFFFSAAINIYKSLRTFPSFNTQFKYCFIFILLLFFNEILQFFLFLGVFILFW